jgi:hypothetical protein
MKRLFKVTGLIAFIMSMISCDLFLARMGGRWNFLDPDYDPVTTTLEPEVDGFVHGETSGAYTTHNRVFAAATLQYDYWFDGVKSGTCCTLIRFDLSDFPSSALVQSAKLILTYNFIDSGAPDPLPVEIGRIAEPWDESSVAMADIQSSTFLAGTPVVDSVSWTALPFGAAVDITWIFTDWIAGSPNYGILIRSSTTYEVSSYASEAGDQGPVLNITYGWVP